MIPIRKLITALTLCILVDSISYAAGYGASMSNFFKSNIIAKPLQEHDKLDGRIVGGYEASILNHPYQVSLQWNNAHICGGAIIDNNIIITAAHCFFEPWKPNAYSVRAGSTLHNQGGQLMGVERIIMHEQYSNVTQDNDIALLLLKGRLQYTASVMPIQLATLNDVLPKLYFVSGWGYTTEDGTGSSVLRFVDVNHIEQQQCKQSYQHIIPITSSMFCAGHEFGGKDSCQGDSGGPLVAVQMRTIKLVGVVSWGIGCAQQGYPGVYTSITAMRPWIESRYAFLRRL